LRSDAVRNEASEAIVNRRFSNRVILFIGLDAFVVGLIFGLLLRSGTDSRPAIEIEKLKVENTKPTVIGAALTEELSSLKTQINERDQEIENLRNKIQDLGREKGEVKRLEKELVRQQQRHVDRQQELEQARKRSTFLENKLRWYRVTRETPLLRNPYEKAEILMHFSAGHKVSTVDVVDGKWLKVHYSRLGNPPGYIRVEDAVLISMFESGDGS
jgi:regulator of replication initiation timing